VQLAVRPGTGTFQAQVFSAAQSKGYFWVLSLESARSGAHTQFTFQNFDPHLGPQVDPLWGLTNLNLRDNQIKNPTFEYQGTKVLIQTTYFCRGCTL
jgi:hypothetical protein